MQALSFYWPFIKLGATDVWRHKTRSFLTMLGMVFGVGSVIAMLAVGEGASHQALESIKRLGSQNIMVNSVKPTSEEGTSSAAQSAARRNPLRDMNRHPDLSSEIRSLSSKI